MSEMQSNRTGTVTEYKKGHFYLTHTEWEDGHIEIEVHRCEPVLFYHSCDPNDLATAKEQFKILANNERFLLPEAPHAAHD